MINNAINIHVIHDELNLVTVALLQVHNDIKSYIVECEIKVMQVQ